MALHTRIDARPTAPLHAHQVTEMCSGSEAGSYLRLIDFVYHSTPTLEDTRTDRRRVDARDVREDIEEGRVDAALSRLGATKLTTQIFHYY